MQSNKRTSPTKGDRMDGNRRLQGSIVLEASLVMPVFVIVIFLFIYMVQMTLLSTQMHAVAANAVKQVSAHMYPVALAVSKQSVDSAEAEGGEQLSVGGKPSSSARSMPGLSLPEWADQYASSLPAPFSNWISSAADKGVEPLQDIKNSVTESVLDPVVKPLIRPFLKGTWLNEHRLHVSRVTVPDMKTGKNPYFGLEISYELPIKVPFTGRPIVLQARAEERLWIGDTGELEHGNGNGEENGEAGQPAVILSKPEPAYAGHRARITARIAPGSTAKLTVYYKSGASQAKYLGEASANGDGLVEWEWLVGGNTTPGTWSFVIETEEGLETAGQFAVESPRSSK
ncbi:TadE family protein [Paenibacillus sp. Marseille-P2973]|uniref:TadE family protein n=1 Tax=Paenibacillus sp. Marseille-P2973 TaxID=1871032 RepID=UPI001FFD7BB3|nr:TadE family protein [Paenibacillus sp. Marseille-P2973]